MAMGKPVIASAFEDTKRMVQPGRTGFLFGAGEKESLKGALRKAWEAKEGWQELGRNARALIVREHSWNQRVCTMVGEIEKMLQARMPGI
jgi:glycosyltransferase involved in cell wall biosynthesis